MITDLQVMLLGLSMGHVAVQYIFYAFALNEPLIGEVSFSTYSNHLKALVVLIKL